MRYFRLYSNEKYILEKRNSYTEKLLSENYTLDEISPSSTKGIDLKQRANLPVANKYINIATTKFQNNLHLTLRHLNQASIKHWDLIAGGDRELFRLHPDLPIITYKRALNLFSRCLNSCIINFMTNPANVFKGHY